MGDVVKLYSKDAASNPDNVLEQAVGNYKSVLVLGWDAKGILDVRASTNIDHKEILWLLEVFKSKLVHGDYSE